MKLLPCEVPLLSLSLLKGMREVLIRCPILSDGRFIASRYLHKSELPAGSFSQASVGERI